MKKGLVLEGGGMRGMFTAGILDVMLEEGITFDGLIGVSAGALFGCNFVSKQPGRALRYNLRFRHEPRYMGVSALLLTGNIVGPKFAYHTMPFELDKFDCETFRQNPTEFWVVCTDVETGTPVYHRIDDMTHDSIQWMQASGSMPLVSQVLTLEGLPLLDGGMTDSIPLMQFQKMGYERNVVILTQPQSYYKSPSNIIWLFRTFCRKYPKIADIMERRYEMYNAQLDYIAEEAKKGNTLLIYPEEPLNISRISQNAKQMQRVHGLGVRKGKEMINEIKGFLL